MVRYATTMVAMLQANAIQKNGEHPIDALF